MAATSISLLTGSTLSGRALAMGGAVSIDTGGGSSTTVPVSRPVINVSGVVNDASYAAPVAAGSIAAVFGTNLALGQSTSTQPTPLPTVLAQSSLVIGGQAGRLYAAMPTQVNVQIPWELAGQTQASIVATVNGVVSTTQTFTLAAFAPGIFSTDMTGTGQGAVLIAPTSTLAVVGNAVSRGAYVSIFCTGLGPVTYPTVGDDRGRYGDRAIRGTRTRIHGTLSGECAGARRYLDGQRGAGDHPHR